MPLNFVVHKFFLKKMVPQGRIELPTQGFSVLCSTDWATEALKWRSGRDLNPRSPVWQTSMLTTTPPDHLFGCGRRIWTYDLRVMSPTSYQTALSRDIWRRKRDLNPRATLITYRFSRPDPSATWVFLRVCKLSIKMVDPTGLEPVTDRLWAGGSNQLSYGSNKFPKMVAPEGFEPTT